MHSGATISSSGIRSLRRAHLPCRLVLYGGRNQEGRRLNDVWTLSTTAWAWERVPTIGAVPPQRSGAAAACHRGRLVIVGGSGNDSGLNDTWVLDLLSAQSAWKQANTTGSRVSLRHSAAHCLHGEFRSGGDFCVVVGLACVDQ